VRAEKSNINLDDNVLVSRCRQGDPQALEHLIIKYQNRIYNVIFKMCANKDDAAELTQETFVKIIENIGGFRGKSSFYTWAFRIAVNLTLNYCKRSLKIGFKSLDSAAADENAGRAPAMLRDLLTDSSSADPARIAQNKELYALVIKAIMKLDEAQRIVLVLRDIEGMNYAGIAEILDIELGTVKSRLSRARSNLKEIMEVI